MTDKKINTIAGQFDPARLASLRETLDKAKADGMDRDDVTMWEGQELVLSFGEYLHEYVSGEFAKRGHNGL